MKFLRLDRLRPISELAEHIGWRRDPLTHPVLRAMTQEQLADLPFDPARISAD